MGNWNYGNGVKAHYEISYGDYVKQHINLKSRGKRSGITFDLRDAFKDLERKGLLIDTKGDGFTKQDALNLYNELDKIHKERKLDRNYTNMQKGAEFNYSEEEVRRLANAAGYRTVEKCKYVDVLPTDHTGVAPKYKYAPINSANKSTPLKFNIKA